MAPTSPEKEGRLGEMTEGRKEREREMEGRDEREAIEGKRELNVEE